MNDETRWTGSRAWYVTVLLSLCYLVSLLDRFIIGLIFDPLEREFGLGDSQLGMLHGTGFVLLYTIAALPMGRLADTRSRRNLIAAGILLWSLATGLCAFASSFATLFAARVLVGLGEACLVPAGMSLLAAIFPAHQLGRAISVFSMGALLGAPIAFAGGGQLLMLLVRHDGMNIPLLGHFEPWRALFLLTGLPGLPLALLFFATVREPLRLSTPSVSVRDALVSMRPRAAVFAPFLGAVCCTALVGYSVPAWCVPLLVRQHDMSVAQAGAVTGAALMIASIVGTLMGGWLTDHLTARYRNGPVLVLGACFLALPVPAVLFCLSQHVWLAVLGLGLLQTVVAIGTPPAFAGFQMLSQERHRGFVTSISVATYTLIGFGCGPALVGFMSDRMYAGTMQLGWSMLTLFVLAAALGLLLCAWLRPRVAAARFAASG